MPHLWTLGLNHHSASLDLRARFAVERSELPQKLEALLAATSAVHHGSSQGVEGLQALQPPELVLVSTCNRTEVYGASPDHAAAREHLARVREWLQKLGDVSAAQLHDHLYLQEGRHSVTHALRVTAGLDSMVLGETQITGQMKDALRVAQEAGTVGFALHLLFQRAFATAKEVRSSTQIGSQTVSMAAVATQLCADVFEHWQHTRVLMIGAGEMIELCLAHFASKSLAHMAIANRTLVRGAQLAQRFSGEGLHIETLALAQIPAHLHAFDVVVSCTASTLPIIGLGAVEEAIRRRRHRPMVMIDLAVPRDIESQVKSLADVYLYTVDDLGAIVKAGQSQREAAAQAAKALIHAGGQQVMARLERAGQMADQIQSLQAKAQQWQMQEIDKVKARLRQMGEEHEGGVVAARWEDVDQALQLLAQGLSKRFLHQAFSQLKSDGKNDEKNGSRGGGDHENDSER